MSGFPVPAAGHVRTAVRALRFPFHAELYGTTGVIGIGRIIAPVKDGPEGWKGGENASLGDGLRGVFEGAEFFSANVKEM